MDGEVIGIAGTYLGPRGEMVVFSSVGDRMKDFPVEIYRQARRIMARVRPPALCMVDKKHERAPQFLQRLGWNISRTPDGELFGWLTR